MLKLSHNHIRHLNVSSLPALHLLYVDCNHLSTIDELETSQNLDTLSMREQTVFLEDGDTLCPLTIDIDFSANLSVRKVYLSCNKLSYSVLSPTSSIPMLQLLDLASCGLEELPSTFGTSFPNLKSLNLNFNALSDVSALEGIGRLSRLSLVGNRITRLRRLCQVLRVVGGRDGCLNRVDLRGNPLTVGFYPSPVSGNGKKMIGAGGPQKMHQLVKRKNSLGDDDGNDEDDVALAQLGGCVDVARTTSTGENRGALIRPDAEEIEVEIDDPYTVPPADAAADEKYVVHLDEATRLRRRVVELMVHAATGSRLKMLDGLDMNCGNGGNSVVSGLKKDWVWNRLVELGVLKRKH